MRALIGIAAAGLMIGAGMSPALAEQDAGLCSETVSPHGLLSAWKDQLGGMAAATPERLADAGLETGKAVRLALSPTAQVSYSAQPGKTGSDETFGGMATVEISTNGVYRVALGGSAWVDVVRDGAVLPSTAHGHGPDCTGIRKIVDFELSPGRYIVQIAASEDDAISIMVAGPGGQ
ncbi:MAG: hypothetical protein R3C40_06940 [Parvularculaceae bacterium]